MIFLFPSLKLIIFRDSRMSCGCGKKSELDVEKVQCFLEVRILMTIFNLTWVKLNNKLMKS